MNLRNLCRASLAVAFASILLVAARAEVFAQGQSGDQAPTSSSKKQVDKAAKKLGKTADQAEHQLGRDAVFCILAAHTTDIGTAQELKDKFDSLDGAIPFGQFVAAVIMADRTDMALDDILNALKSGKSLGQIAKDGKSDMGDLHSGLGQFRSELARSMTNPPTTDCFATTP